METIINDVEKANDILARYKGTRAEIWSYNKFLDKIELMIDIENDNLMFITLVSCKCYNGDLYWSNSDLKITEKKNKKGQWTTMKISDLKTGFYIECASGFTLEIGEADEFSERLNVDVGYDEYLKRTLGDKIDNEDGDGNG
jgi:hypothetical protein